MAIKFSSKKKKDLDPEEKKPSSVIEFTQEQKGSVSVNVGVETQKKNLNDIKKSELKYIRMKKACGAITAISAGIFTLSGADGIIKAVKEKDSTRGVAAGIATALGIGLGGVTGAIFTDAKYDKKEFDSKYGK